MGSGAALVFALEATKPADFPSFRAEEYVRPQMESTRINTCRVLNELDLREARYISKRSHGWCPIGYNGRVGRTR